ncbi:hypothetical protein Hanom_Chr14g01295511 [Helianthus anomalus]
MQLEDLISKHVAIMEEETKNIITRHPDSTDQDNVNLDQARQLQKLISKRLRNLHAETQKILAQPPNSIKQDNQPVSNKGDQALEP